MDSQKLLEQIRQIEEIRSNVKSNTTVQLYMSREKIQEAHIAMLQLGRANMTLAEFIRRAIDIETKRLLEDMKLENNDKKEYENSEMRELDLKTKLLECREELEKIKNELLAERENKNQLLLSIQSIFNKFQNGKKEVI